MQLGNLARWIKRDGGVWHGQLSEIHTSGSGREILFLHGLAASADCWTGTKQRMGSRYRFSTVQMKGFAGLEAPIQRPATGYLKAMADDLAQYISKNAKGPVAVCGHSMGGLVSLILARDHPQFVERVMVVDVPAFFSVLINPFATEGTLMAFAEVTRRRYIDRERPRLESDLRKAAQGLVRSEADLEKVVKWGVESDQTLTADVMAEVMTTDLRPDMGRIQCPTDIVYAWDPSTPATRSGLEQTYASAYSELTNSNRTRIEGARHYVMLDQPEEFHRAVKLWLAR